MLIKMYPTADNGLNIERSAHFNANINIILLIPYNNIPDIRLKFFIKSEGLNEISLDPNFK